MATRGSALTLFSGGGCIYSHRARFVLAEKAVTDYRLIQLHGEDESEDLLELNPRHSVPTLVDRELVVDDARILIEYVDERYPHPPLMPVDPILRARYRLAILRMDSDLYTLFDALDAGGATARKARERMTELLTQLAADFSPRTWIGDEFSLLDCTLGPVLWRLSHYDVTLAARASKALDRYGERLFARDAFQASLSAVEADMTC